MKKRNIIYIVVAIICVVSIIVGVYYQVFKSNPQKPVLVANEEQNNNIIIPGTDIEDPDILIQEFNMLLNNKFNSQGYDASTIEKLPGLEEQDIVYLAYNIKEEKDEKYNVAINLPAININSEVVSGFNNTTNINFSNKASEVLLNSQKYTIYSVDFAAYLNENILSVVIKSNLKEGNSPQRVIVQTYNYDVNTKKAVTLNDVLASRDISVKDVNKKIEKQVKEAANRAEAVASALANQGQTVYERDVNNAIYVTDNVNHFFIGEEGQIYIVYPYGNSKFTSEMDIIKV